jgi:hypothetical protein
MTLPLERGIPPQYNIYQKMKVSDVCESGFVEHYYSRNDLKSNVLDFVVEGNSEHIIIPSKTYLKLKVELIGGEASPGTKTVQAKDAVVAPVNNIMHSLFGNVHVYLSTQPTTKTDHNYAYTSYLQTLCDFGAEPLNTNFELTGFVKDVAGKHDLIDDKHASFKKKRKMFMDYDNRVELIGKIFSPVFMQSKVLPTQVTMRVQLEKKQSSDFYLMHNGGRYELNIVEASLMVQKAIPTVMFKESYGKHLEDGKPIPYHLNIPSVNHLTIESGSSQYMRDNLFLGKAPHRIILAMVETDAYQGTPNKNPFNFQHFNISEICLYKDGVPFPRPLTRMSFDDGKCAEAYHNFMMSVNGSYTKMVPDITMNDFMNGYTLFSYDMAPDQIGSINHSSMLNKYSNIRLEMKFSPRTTSNITLLVYCERDHLMEIHKDRRVTIDL